MCVSFFLAVLQQFIRLVQDLVITVVVQLFEDGSHDFHTSNMMKAIMLSFAYIGLLREHCAKWKQRKNGQTDCGSTEEEQSDSQSFISYGEICFVIAFVIYLVATLMKI